MGLQFVKSDPNIKEKFRLECLCEFLCEKKQVFWSKNTVLSPFQWVEIFTFAYGQGHDYGASGEGTKNFDSGSGSAGIGTSGRKKPENL